VLRISEVFPGAGEELLEAARENGLEGIVAKHASSRYESRRSREWLKIKIVGEQEFVIGGFTEPQGGRDYFGALVLGVTRRANCAGWATSAPASTRNCWPASTRACSR
jgi:bifunctional non-homologous end joining protein LigD